MKKLGVVGDALGQLGGVGKQLGQQVVSTSKDAAKDAAKQIVPQTPENTIEAEKSAEQAAENSTDTKQTTDIVKSLYGVDQKNNSSQSQQQAGKDQPFSKDTKKLLEHNKDKTPEEMEKIMQLRNELHQAYVAELNRPKQDPEQAQKDAERASERVERLEMEDLQETKKKEDKQKPLAVQMEREKAEKFRGAAG